MQKKILIFKTCIKNRQYYFKTNYLKITNLIDMFSAKWTAKECLPKQYNDII